MMSLLYSIILKFQQIKQSKLCGYIMRIVAAELALPNLTKKNPLRDYSLRGFSITCETYLESYV